MLLESLNNTCIDELTEEDVFKGRLWQPKADKWLVLQGE